MNRNFPIVSKLSVSIKYLCFLRKQTNHRFFRNMTQIIVVESFTFTLTTQTFYLTLIIMIHLWMKKRKMLYREWVRCYEMTWDDMSQATGSWVLQRFFVLRWQTNKITTWIRPNTEETAAHSLHLLLLSNGRCVAYYLFTLDETLRKRNLGRSGKGKWAQMEPPASTVDKTRSDARLLCSRSISPHVHAHSCKSEL